MKRHLSSFLQYPQLWVYQVVSQHADCKVLLNTKVKVDQAKGSNMLLYQYWEIKIGMENMSEVARKVVCSSFYWLHLFHF